jgi:putative transposase
VRVLTMIGYDRVMHPRQPYPTDLSDNEWALLNHLVPEAKPGGRPEAYPKREMLNAIFDLLRSGCSWRMLPHDLPPWRLVYHYFRTWGQDGTWQIRPDLRRGDGRVAAGKPRQPRAGIVDSQAVKTTATGGPTGTMPTNTSTAANGISSSTR